MEANEILFGMTWEQLVSFCTIIIGAVGLFWKLKIDIVKIKKDFSRSQETTELKILELKKDIQKVDVDLQCHKSDNRLELDKYIKENRDDHRTIGEKLDRINEHLINK
jgi:hypothetical protein